MGCHEVHLACQPKRLKCALVLLEQYVLYMLYTVYPRVVVGGPYIAHSPCALQVFVYPGYTQKGRTSFAPGKASDYGHFYLQPLLHTMQALALYHVPSLARTTHVWVASSR